MGSGIAVTMLEFIVVSFPMELRITSSRVGIAVIVCRDCMVVEIESTVLAAN